MKKNYILLLTIILFYQINAQILNVEAYRIRTDTLGWAGKDRYKIFNGKKYQVIDQHRRFASYSIQNQKNINIDVRHIFDVLDNDNLIDNQYYIRNIYVIENFCTGHYI